MNQNPERWTIIDVEVPFKCICWWMLKNIGAALLIYGTIAIIFGLFWFILLALGMAAAGAIHR